MPNSRLILIIAIALIAGYLLHDITQPPPAHAQAAPDEADTSAGPWRVIPVTVTLDNVNPDHGGGAAVYHSAIRYNQRTGEAENYTAEIDQFGVEGVWRPIGAW